MALQREIRGGLLNAAVQVERALDLILANHFFKPHSERWWWHLYSLVLASRGMTFSRKSAIVFELLRNFYPELLTKHERIKKRVEKIITDRNKFAHAELVFCI